MLFFQGLDAAEVSMHLDNLEDIFLFPDTAEGYCAEVRGTPMLWSVLATNCAIILAPLIALLHKIQCRPYMRCADALE